MDDVMEIGSHLDDRYMHKLDDVSYNPIFILGLHRSGTSILYKMLSDTGQFNVVTGYHILKFDELLYNHINNLEKNVKKEIENFLKNKGITDRKIDHIAVSADYAHEYVFIFQNRDLPQRITNKNISLFENICKKIKYISGNSNPLLLKNPFDYSNFLFIKKIYPNVKFIFINRNPLQVISSTMRTWKIILENKNEYTALFSKKYTQIYDNPFLLFMLRIYYTSRFPIGIFNVIYSSFKETKYFLKNINRLSENDYISIKYEDLCREPNKTISNIMDFLNLKYNKDFSTYIKQRNLDLIPEVKLLKKVIFKKMKPYFRYLNLSLD